MQEFDDKAMAHLKKLCRIDCGVEEEAEIMASLKKILGAVSDLSEVDTEGVKPCSFVLRSMLKNQLREDVVADVLNRDAFLANCPDQIGGMVRVPPVLK